MSLEQVMEVLRAELAMGPKPPAIGMVLAAPDQYRKLKQQYDEDLHDWHVQVCDAVLDLVAEHDRSTS